MNGALGSRRVVTDTAPYYDVVTTLTANQKAKPLPGGRVAVLFVNIGTGAAVTVAASFAEIGYAGGVEASVTEVWGGAVTHADSPNGVVATAIAPHDSLFVIVAPMQGDL